MTTIEQSRSKVDLAYPGGRPPRRGDRVRHLQTGERGVVRAVIDHRGRVAVYWDEPNERTIKVTRAKVDLLELLERDWISNPVTPPVLEYATGEKPRCNDLVFDPKTKLNAKVQGIHSGDGTVYVRWIGIDRNRQTLPMARFEFVQRGGMWAEDAK